MAGRRQLQFGNHPKQQLNGSLLRNLSRKQKKMVDGGKRLQQNQVGKDRLLNGGLNGRMVPKSIRGQVRGKKKLSLKVGKRERLNNQAGNLKPQHLLGRVHQLESNGKRPNQHQVGRAKLLQQHFTLGIENLPLQSNGSNLMTTLRIQI